MTAERNSEPYAADLRAWADYLPKFTAQVTQLREEFDGMAADHKIEKPDAPAKPKAKKA